MARHYTSCCKNCKFYVVKPEREEDSHRGVIYVRKPGVNYCYRYPQTVQKHEDDWCGEFLKATISEKFKELLDRSS